MTIPPLDDGLKHFHRLLDARDELSSTLTVRHTLSFAEVEQIATRHAVSSAQLLQGVELDTICEIDYAKREIKCQGTGDI